MKRASVVGILGLAWSAGLGGCTARRRSCPERRWRHVYLSDDEQVASDIRGQGYQDQLSIDRLRRRIQQMTSQTVTSAAPMPDERRALEKAKEVNGDVVHIPLVMGAVVPAYP